VSNSILNKTSTLNILVQGAGQDRVDMLLKREKEIQFRTRIKMASYIKRLDTAPKIEEMIRAKSVF